LLYRAAYAFGLDADIAFSGSPVGMMFTANWLDRAPDFRLLAGLIGNAAAWLETPDRTREAHALPFFAVPTK